MKPLPLTARLALAVLLAAAIALAGALLPEPRPASASQLAVSSIAITSSAGSDTEYHAGDSITIRVTFDASVKSFTNAALVFAIGSNNRSVTVADDAAHNSATLDFTYTVTPADADSDGIGVGALSGSYVHVDSGADHNDSDLGLGALTLGGTPADHRVNVTTVDYDNDNNGLIEISTRAQLNAVRWDANGDGEPSAANRTTYWAAFPKLTPAMGCPDTAADADSDPGPCAGYELAADLNLSGSTWEAIPSFSGTFDGKGHTISNLSIETNTYVSGGWNPGGLFYTIASGAVVRNLGLINPRVWETQEASRVGALAGQLTGGTVYAVYSRGGRINTDDQSGGLIGLMTGGSVTASYSTTEIRPSEHGAAHGGLVGDITGGVVTASYAASSVVISSYVQSGSTNLIGGLIGRGSSTVTNSYWDTVASSRTISPGGGSGQTTTQLQSPTGYTGIYANWNIDVDNADGDSDRTTGVDDPWDFGTNSQYPVLKSGGHSPQKQGRPAERIALTQNDAAINALALDEGATASYGVALTGTAPTAGVTLTITSGDTAVEIDDGSGTYGSSRTLTFSTANWETAQTVTIRAASDTDIAVATVALTHTAADATSTASGFAGQSRSLNVTVTDTTTPDILLTQGGSAITALSVTEQGSNVDYGVALGQQPTGAVTITIAATGVSIDTDGDSTFSASETLSFTTANYNTAQTVTVQAPAHDANSSNETGSLAHSGSGGGYGSASASLSVTIVDNDQPGLDVSATSLTLTEATTNNDHQGSFTVRLNTQPSGTVDVRIDSNNDDVELRAGSSGNYGSSASLSFTASTYNTNQTVNVQAGPDDDAENDTAALSFTITGYGSVTHSDFTVNVTDDDTRGFIFNPTSLTATNAITEGTDTGSYTVRLATQPTATVTVSITSSNSEVTVRRGSSGSFGSTASLSFSTTNWNSAQTVTVRAADDSDSTNDTASLTHTGSGGGYGDGATGPLTDVTGTMSVTVTDDDTPGIRLSRTALTITEQATRQTYTVRLNTLPSAAVTVAISKTNADVELSTDDSTYGTSASLSFSVTNWNTPQTVYVRAGNDADGEGDADTLTHRASDATGTASGYANLTRELALTVTDNDTKAITLNPTSLSNVNEGTNTTTYTVRLATQPTAGVTVTATSSDPAAVRVRLGGSGNFGNSASLTFTAANYTMAQTITVEAREDADSSNESVTISHSAADTTSGSASGYGDPDGNGPLTAVSRDLSVGVTDDDTPGLNVSAGPLSLDEDTTGNGHQGSFTVSLNTQPTGTVTVRIDSDNDDVELSSDGGTTYSSFVSLSFTGGATGNYGTDQTVNVQAGPDDDGENDTAALSFTISDGGYGSVTHGDFTVNVTDDDPKGITFNLDPASLTVGEGTQNGSYTVVLDTEPTAAVTVSISSNNNDVTVRRGSSGSFGASASLTFSTTNWDTAQTVTVRAAEDNDSANDTATLTHTGSGGGYGDGATGPLTDVTGTMSVTVTDNDTPGINLSRTALTITEEAARQTYTVRLNTQPSATVTVAVSKTNDDVKISDDDSDYTSPVSLSFSTTNWDTPQTVYVKAEDDADGEGDADTLTHDPSGGDYNSVSNATLALTITDDDTKAIVLNPTSLSSVNEGTSNRTYTVRLATQPTGNVTVVVSSDNAAVRVRLGGSGNFGSTASLTFSTTNWNSAQTVTVEAPEDDNSINENVTISHVGSGGGYGDGNGPAADISQNLSVSVADDDTPSLRVSASSLSLTETTAGNGHQSSFNVRLNTQPTGTVTVGIASDNDDVRVRTGSGSYGSSVSLSFTGGSGGNYGTDQAVNVQAGQDLDGDNDVASLTFSISGGDYDSVTQAAVSVTVTDDDPKGITLSQISSLAVSEGAAPASYTVVLDTQPSGTARVAVSSSDPAKVSVSRRSGGGFGSRITLSFNRTNYGTAQTVYARGNADDNTVSETGISLAHTASGGGYAGIAESLSVTLTDTSTPGLVIAPTPLDIKESTEGNYTVRLSTQPASSVTVTISRGAGIAVTFDHDGDGTFGAGNQDLTFTAGNWNRPQAVKVRAPSVPADDTATLSHTAGGADYGSVSGSLTVNVRDNLPPVAEAGANQQAYSGQTITLAGSATDPDDAASTLTYAWRQSAGAPEVTLSGANTARPRFTVPTTLTADTQVEFELTVTDPSGRTHTDTVKATLLAARPNELVSLQVSDRAGNRPLTPPFASIRRSFETSVGAYATTARIILMPADDAATVSFAGRLVPPDAAGVRAATVHLAEGSNRYTIVVTPAPVAAGSNDTPLPPVIYLLNIRRQPVPRLAFAPARIVMDEGAAATYTVNLDTRWLGAAVTVAIASDNPAVTVSPASVQFTPTNWAPRPVTVTAAQDADGDDDTASINHRASGGHFDNVYGRLRVEIADDDGDGTPEPTPTPTPAPGATPTPTPTPEPTPMPTPTPPPGLPTVAETNIAEALLDGHTVTITRTAGSLWGVTVALPAALTRDLAITIAPLPKEVPRSSARFGLGMTDAAPAGALLTMVGAPAGGLEVCLPLSEGLVSEAGNRPLTLVRYDDAGAGQWQALPDAVQREMTVCAAGLSGGTYAAAYIITPPLGPASALTVSAGDAPGTLILRWTPGAQATRHWVAGIKQSDWDANDFSSLIWMAASGSNTHTLTGLASGAEYVFTIAAGRRVNGVWEWSAWTALARGTPQ